MTLMRTVSPVAIGATAVVLSALLGGLFGGRVLATQEDIPQYYDEFSAALAVIEANYVDEIETEHLIYGAIGGMLQTLDPHSNFMDRVSHIFFFFKLCLDCSKFWSHDQIFIFPPN